MLGTNIGTTLRQCCLNIVSMSIPIFGHQYCDNVHTTLPECCHNVSPQHWQQLCHNIHTTLPEHCLNVDHNCWGVLCHIVVPMLADVNQHCGNIGILVKIQHWYNIHTMFSGHPHSLVGTFESIYKWTLPQRWEPTLRQR